MDITFVVDGDTEVLFLDFYFNILSGSLKDFLSIFKQKRNNKLLIRFSPSFQVFFFLKIP